MAGVLPRRKNKRNMENQEEKETSLEYYESKVSLFIIQNRSIDTGFLIDALNDAKKMYAEEIAKAFEKGYEEGVKYTDGLISDEKFPF
jgi:hypothetical protein